MWVQSRSNMSKNRELLQNRVVPKRLSNCSTATGTKNTKQRLRRCIGYSCEPKKDPLLPTAGRSGAPAAPSKGLITSHPHRGCSSRPMPRAVLATTSCVRNEFAG
jgi:hypothetical protein